MALSIIVELAFTPIMIRLLGKSEYGLYNTVASTISMLSILSLGFNSSYIKYYSIYKKDNDKEGISKLNAMFLLVFVAIGFVALLCGLFLSANLNFVFKTGLTNDEYSIARILMILLTINLAISFPMSVFGNIISAHERFVILKLVNMLRTIMGPLISLPILLSGYRSFGLVLTMVIVSLCADTTNAIYVFVVLKEKFIFKSFDKGLLKRMTIYTSFIAINIIVDQINTNIDNLLLARFKGTGQVAVYAVGSRLYTAFVRFSTAVSGVFTPRVHSISNGIEDIAQKRLAYTSLLSKVGRIQFLILGLVATGILFFGKPFIRFWAGEGFEDSYYVALLLIIPAIIPLIQNIGIEIQRAENKHQFRSIFYIIMAIINLGISYFLCQIYGAIGTTIGTSLSLLIANGLIMNIFYHKKCHIDIITFWRNILGILKGLLIPCLFGIVCNTVFKINRFDQFSGLILIYTLVYIGTVWILGMNHYEKNLVIGSVKKIVDRYKTSKLN